MAAKYLPADASARQTAELYASLRVEELALARACAAGQERAWEIFMARYREKLYDIAAYIAKESSAARELADSLYADLYGTTTRDGQRISKLASYTGTRLFGRLAAHRDGAGIREPLSPPAPPGQPGRRE